MSLDNLFLRTAGYFVVIGTLMGCAEKDTMPPPAPRLDPIISPTSLDSQQISGTAEYGSTVRIVGEENDITLTADPFTAEFFTNVKLNTTIVSGETSATTLLTLQAIDAAGNTSQPTTAKIVYQAPHLKALQLELGEANGSADEGSLHFQVVANSFADGIDPEGMQVTVSVENYPISITPLTLNLNSAGTATGRLDGLTYASAGKLVATAVAPRPDGTQATVSREFEIQAGAPTQIDLTLSAVVNENVIGPADTVTVPAGTPIAAQVTVKDSQGNEIKHPEIHIATDLPDAQIFGTQLTGITTEGVWTIYAIVPETLSMGTATLQVEAAQGVAVRLQLDRIQLNAGESVMATGWVEDVYGNTTSDQVTLSNSLPVYDQGGPAQDPQDFVDVQWLDGVITGKLIAKTAGSFVVSASTPELTATSLPLVVSPNSPTKLIIYIDKTNAPFKAGETVAFTYSVMDAYQNPTGHKIKFLIDSQEATVIDNAVGAGTIQGLTRAGNYTLQAQVDGANLSETASVVIEPTTAATIILTLDESQPTAGTTIKASGWVEDVYGNITSDPVTLSNNLPVYDQGGPAEDPQEFVQATGELTVLTAGSFIVTASSAALPNTTAELEVLPAPASTLSFDIDQTNAPFEAGEAVPYTYAVTDAFGNMADSSVIVSVSAPSVVITNDGLGAGEVLGLVRAATYTVNARAVGTLLSDTELVTIDPNPGEGFNLTLSAVLIVEGSKALVFVTDAFGNPIALADVDFFVDGAPVTPGGSTGRELTFGAAGTFTVSASLKSVPAIIDSELISVQSVADTLPPTASITNIVFPSGTSEVPMRSHIDVEILFEDNFALADGALFAQFGADATCTSDSGLIFLAGQSSFSTTADVRLPGCAFPTDQINLIVKVYDQAGNVGYSLADSSLTVAAPPGFGVTDGNPDYHATMAAYGDRINQGDNPVDVAIAPNSGVSYISLANNDEIIVAFPDRSQDRLRDTNNNRYRPAQPEGIALTSDGYLFIGAVGNQRIEVIPPWFPPGTTIADNVSGRPNRLAYDDLGAIPMLCGAQIIPNQASCYLYPSSSGLPLVIEFSVNIGKTARAVDVAVDTVNNTSGVLWILANDCSVYRADLTYDIGNSAVNTTSAVALVLDTALSNDCRDLVTLPSGDVAIADRGDNRIVRVTPAGVVSEVAAGFQNLTGLDYDSGFLYALDGSIEALFKIEALTTSF